MKVRRGPWQDHLRRREVKISSLSVSKSTRDTEITQDFMKSGPSLPASPLLTHPTLLLVTSQPTSTPRHTPWPSSVPQGTPFPGSRQPQELTVLCRPLSKTA